MNLRSESVNNRLEKYTYDNLDRLTKITAGSIGQTGTVQNFSYLPNGNINTNSLLGSYNYLSNKPNAVTKIEPINNNVISENQCGVTYNLFNQPIQIKEASAALSHQLDLFYGSDQQRNKAVQYENTVEICTRYYINKYYEHEKFVPHPQINRYYHYIYGNNCIVALHIADNTANTDSMYYIHTDHLGSYCAITTSAKTIRQRNLFDPWGNNVGQINYSLINRGFTGHEHYPALKIINMNGRLYDPVIARFFSPDQFVANSSFTQDFNRYSYCRNNPLHYTDPSGQKITGYDVFSALFLPVFMPARFLSECFTLINDKINGDVRHGGYFSPSYLVGQTEPGSLTPYNPVNYIHYGQPGHINHGPFVGRNTIGTGWDVDPDDEWSKKFYRLGSYALERKIGSKKVIYISKKTAATGGVNIKSLGKIILGTYVGKFEGVNVYESSIHGQWSPRGGYSGVTIPERGIIVATGLYKEDEYNNDKWYMRHEFGHILQYRKFGTLAYYRIIAPESFLSATMHGKLGWNHNNFWTETYANYLSSKYFTDESWTTDPAYCPQNISWYNLLRLRAAMLP
jgi:RHS repeat-associated protein